MHKEFGDGSLFLNVESWTIKFLCLARTDRKKNRPKTKIRKTTLFGSLNCQCLMHLQDVELFRFFCGQRQRCMLQCRKGKTPAQPVCNSFPREINNKTFLLRSPCVKDFCRKCIATERAIASFKSSRLCLEHVLLAL